MTSHYLYTHYECDGISAPLDASVEEIVAQMITGAERCGSGMGGGVRDLEFRIIEEPTQELLVQVRDKIKALVQVNGIVEVTYDSWPSDTDSDDYEPIVSMSSED